MILITGAKGFIGSSLLSFLNERGYNAGGVNEEITDIEKLRPYFKNAEFVVHLAAKVIGIQTERESNGVFEVNVVGTMNVVKLCLEYGCKLVNMSTIATGSEYAISKMVAEDIVRLYSKYLGLSAVTIQPCIIYNENDGDRHPFINRYYPLGKLVRDIENIIIHHDFKKYRVYKIGGIGQKLYFRNVVRLYRRIKRTLFILKVKLGFK